MYDYSKQYGVYLEYKKGLWVVYKCNTDETYRAGSVSEALYLSGCDETTTAAILELMCFKIDGERTN